MIYIICQVSDIIDLGQSRLAERSSPLRVIRGLAIHRQRRPLSVVDPIGDKLGHGCFVREVPQADTALAAPVVSRNNGVPPSGL